MQSLNILISQQFSAWGWLNAIYECSYIFAVFSLGEGDVISEHLISQQFSAWGWLNAIYVLSLLSANYHDTEKVVFSAVFSLGLVKCNL